MKRNKNTRDEQEIQVPIIQTYTSNVVLQKVAARYLHYTHEGQEHLKRLDGEFRNLQAMVQQQEDENSECMQEIESLREELMQAAEQLERTQQKTDVPFKKL
ncbi:MAG: hypothetical protein FWG71_08370, partial [Synergistaceae bacterium]|nr:hypothetical protein [Synergistaceae bacterium]